MATIIAGAKEADAATAGRRAVGGEWTILAGLGIAFALVSLLDIGLTFYPVGFGSAEWEFGTATSVMDNIPLALVGVGLVAVAGMGGQTRWLVVAARIVAAVVSVVLLLSVFMFVRHIAEALASVADPVLLRGLKKSIARTAVQLVAYTAGMMYVVLKAR